MTYYPKNTNADGSLTVVLRYKLSFHLFSSSNFWTCPSLNCGNQTSLELNMVDQESSGEWFQREGIMTRQVPINSQFQLELSGNAWINNNYGISRWKAVTGVELGNRSDIRQANTSPQTTILPALRVPSNCQRDFHLLDFDPDGDEVRCRYANSSLSECTQCTTPSVLSLSESCILSFSPNSSVNEGPYIVQMVMEDFPRQTISLTQNGGLTVTSAISKIPVQFAVRVDPAVPSCTEGLYLPRFLTPTPANKAQLYTPVNQTLSISVNAEANVSTTLELLFSGPYNMNKSSLGAGRFLLRWTPSQEEDGESHPICFVIQSITNSTTKYQSELRCVIVTVGNEPTITTAVPSTTPPVTGVSKQGVVAMRINISSASPLSEDFIRSTIIQQIKDELVRKGLPSDITLRLVRSVQLGLTTRATPVN
ncbi:uncharacterized protein LOC117561596 isoform X2 [Gymnodraco acuticeps]|nr:uncharacterized protein LOC117561596 isoform X2 [Gymnodraco acuticeps]